MICLNDSFTESFSSLVALEYSCYSCIVLIARTRTIQETEKKAGNVLCVHLTNLRNSVYKSRRFKSLVL